MPAPTLLLEGPFESDYSLSIVNRNLAQAIHRMGISLRLHQRDNTTPYFPADSFLSAHQDLAPLFVRDIRQVTADVHSRYIYPPYTDGFKGKLRVVHCYGWEESIFPRQFVAYFNGGLDLITVMSQYVKDVLIRSGVTVPIEVVGLGADHIISTPATPVEWVDSESFDFLHVSSCFPRKAADILVRAFCGEFTAVDGVRLIIKTLPNPHNEIDRIVREVGQQYPRHAPIKVVFDSLSPGEMRYLYEHAGCLVSASRGEGFGLPVAEAMLVGCPVIATIYSGQADICRPDHCWPVDYKFEPARTHLTEGDSVWANPTLSSLQAQMRDLYNVTKPERTTKTGLARDFVLSRFTWKDVAQRHWDSCQASLKSSKPMHAVVADLATTERHIGFVTTWNTKCGIAEYTRYLAGSLPDTFRFSIFANRPWEELVRSDEDFVTRCWEPFNPDRPEDAKIEELAEAILKSGVRVISIQYTFKFFTPAALAKLVQLLRREHIVTTVTMHGVRHSTFSRLKLALGEAGVCICHRQEDVDAVRQLGLENVVLQKQGIVASRLDTTEPQDRDSPARFHFLIGCFGFFLPPKGIDQLIQAFALAKSVQPLLRLKLLNSLYPISASTEYARRCMGLIDEKGLRGDIEICTGFLDHEETLRELAESDLVVLPYVYSSESSSAAGAFAIASLKPVLCSSLPLFDELSGAAHRFPAGNVFALANKILELAADPTELNRYRAAQEELVRSRAWPVVARHFAKLIAAQESYFQAQP
jgi:glycosyltransferase involved in cell wall biosynthesis